MTIASRGSLILADSFAIAVTWRQTRVANLRRTETPKRPSLEQVMWANGMFDAMLPTGVGLHSDSQRPFCIGTLYYLFVTHQPNSTVQFLINLCAAHWHL